MDNMIIRDATENDAESILKIYDYYVRNTAISFEYTTPSVLEFRKRIAKTLEHFPYIVIEKDNKVVGYAYAGSLKPREAYKYSVELSIYVDKDFKRGGIGRMLYEDIEKKLAAMGIKNLYACIAYPSDKEDEYLSYDSVRFHEHMSYNKIGRLHKCGYKFDRWYDIVWMEKFIENQEMECQ